MKNDKKIRYFLIALTIGVWIIVLQNFGILPPIRKERVIVKDIQHGEVTVNGGSITVTKGHNDDGIIF
jgi:hypothetical protein